MRLTISVLAGIAMPTLITFDPEGGDRAPADGGSATPWRGTGDAPQGPRWWQRIVDLFNRILDAVLRSRFTSVVLVVLLLPPGLILFAHGGSVLLIANAANLGAIGGGLLAALHGLRRLRGIKPGTKARQIAGTPDTREESEESSDAPEESQ